MKGSGFRVQGSVQIVSFLLLCVLCGLCGFALPGCGGDARVELAAGDAVGAIADSFDTAIDEYHQDVSTGDDGREAAAIAAFTARVTKDAGDEDLVAEHAEEFAGALGKIRSDREVEWVRWTTAKGNVRELRELGKGLSRLAVQSMALGDEVQRYLTGWQEAYQRSRQQAAEQAAQRRSERQANRQQLAGQVVGAIQSRRTQAAPRGQ